MGDTERAELPGGAVRLTVDDHVVLCRRLRPGHLLFVTVQGTGNTASRALMMREVTREIAEHGSVTIHADMRNTPRLDSQGRDEWSTFGRAHRAALRGIVLLVRSRLVEMAMTLVGVFVGGGLLRVYSREADFVEAVTREVPEFTSAALRVR